MSQRNTGLTQLLREQTTAPLSELRAQIKSYWKKGTALRRAGDWMAHSVPSDLFKNHKVVGFFVTQPHFDEAQALPALPETLESAYPICGPERRMTFHLARAQDLQYKNIYGISEPAEELPKVQPTLLFVPALLADSRGNRIGRGGGYYDSYLASHPTTQTVGVLHSDYVFEDGLPTHWLQAHDLKLSALLTEKDFIWCDKEIST